MSKHDREVGATLRELAARMLEAANRLDPITINVDDSGSPGAALIATERVRQITEEGYSAAHDRSHGGQELAWGAYGYLFRAARTDIPQDDPAVPLEWPWPKGQWKPKGSRVRNLVVAGALIAAEVDRLYAEGER